MNIRRKKRIKGVVKVDYESKYDDALNILADIREVLLPLVNPKENICGDMLACTVSEPSCIKHLAEQIAKQYKEQAEKAKHYEKVIHNIANIDTMFMNPDGTEREFNAEEALQEIDNMVTPIWNEHCEKSWEKHRKNAKKTDLL